MFGNIGGKIKLLAAVICALGMVASVICAIVLWSDHSRYNDTIALGFGVMFGGCFVSWVGSCFMYGFGQLIEDTALIRGTLLPQGEQPAQAPVQPVVKESFIKKPTNDLSGWSCPHCKFFNSNDHHECTYCGKRKPAARPLSDVMSAIQAKNSCAGWTCPHCKFFNTSNPDTCTYCGKAK